MFYANFISASNVALHFPSSSNPFSNFDGFPTFLSKFL